MTPAPYSTDNVQTSVLYGPYGTTRYTNGTMPGSYGYTGQHADATTGLDYYNARYYDASAGQFASADTARDGLNRYGYVHGNPTTANDPSGHLACQMTSCDGGGSVNDPSQAVPVAAPTPTPTKPAPTTDGDNQKQPTEIEMCNAEPKCKQQKEDDSNKNFWEGLFGYIGAIVAIVGLCVIAPPACGSWVAFFLGPAEAAYHTLLKGIREKLELDGGSLMLRMLTIIAMLLGDIGGMFVNVYNIVSNIGELTDLVRGIKSIGEFAKVLAAGGAKGPIASALFEVKDGTLEFFNFTDLQEDTAAFWEAGDEWVNSLS